MSQGFKITAIALSLEKEIANMQKKIKEIFNLDISKIDASKIIGWKAKSYNINLSKSKLVEILGMRENEQQS